MQAIENAAHGVTQKLALKVNCMTPLIDSRNMIASTLLI
jgi:hypothetical protein